MYIYVHWYAGWEENEAFERSTPPPQPPPPLPPTTTQPKACLVLSCLGVRPILLLLLLFLSNWPFSVSKCRRAKECKAKLALEIWKCGVGLPESQADRAQQSPTAESKVNGSCGRSRRESSSLFFPPAVNKK